MDDIVERVAEGLARGHSNKVIAYDNGIALSTVWRAQMRLAARFGVTTRVELIARLRGGDVSIVGLPLTASERIVIELALCGKSNAQIAHERGVAMRTIANQLAMAYRKLGIHSRSELAAMMFDATA